MIILRLLRVFALTTALALLSCGASQAAGGQLDPDFGDGGWVAGSAPQEADLGGFAAARSPGGKIYVDEGPGLFAFLPDGSRDRGFGASGSAVFASLRWPVYFTVARVAVDAQGRILVAGSTFDNERQDEAYSVATVVRYLPDGRLDPSFGEGGVLRTTFGFPIPRDESGLSPGSAGHVAVRITGLGIDAEGRIVLAGSYSNRIVKCPDGIAYEMPLGFLARLAPDGGLDPTYGQDGLAIQPGLGLITDLRVESSGASAFVATSAGCGLPHHGFIARVKATGEFNGLFGFGGRRRIAEAPTRLTVDAAGQFLVLFAPRRLGQHGGAHSETSVRRYLPAGGLDHSFARRGRAVLRLPGRSSLFGAIAVDSRAGILLAGAVHPPGSGPPRRFVLARLGRDGRPDRSFGEGGMVTTGFGARARGNARAILTEPGGAAILAGSLGASYVVNGRGFALARYLP
jgi:uncharacterized delta-60 repeat protein